MSYTIVGKGRFDDRPSIKGGGDAVNSTINRAVEIMHREKLQSVVVVTESLRVVFSDKRKCKCKNSQYYFGEDYGIYLKCEDCGVIFPEEAEVEKG